MEIGGTVYDAIAEGVSQHFAEGWEVAGYDWPDISPDLPAVTWFPGGHDSFVVPDGFGTEIVSGSLIVWLPADDERQSLQQFYAMTAAFRSLARSFAVDDVGVSGVELVRVLEPRIVSVPDRSAFVGQFDVRMSVSTC